MMNLYFLSSEFLTLTMGLEFLCDVFISINEIFSLIDLINASTEKAAKSANMVN